MEDLDSTNSSELNTDSDSISESSTGSDTLRFVIVLDSQLWDQMKPVEKIYKDNRAYDTFQKGWADIISLKMWKATKQQCAYAFRKHHIYKSEN